MKIQQVSALQRTMAKFGQGKLRKEIIWATLTKISTMLLFFATGAVLTRRLGREGFGQWSYVYSALNMVLLISILGLNGSVRVHIARHTKSPLLRRVLFDGSVLRLLSSAAFAGFILLFGRYFVSALGLEKLHELVGWGAGFVFVQGLTESAKEIFQGFHRIRYSFVVNTAEFGLKFVFVFFFIQSGSSDRHILIAFVMASAIAAAWAWYAIIFSFYRRAENAASPSMAIALLKYAVPIFIINLSAQFSFELNTFLLGMLSSAGEVGIYEPAKMISLRLPHIGLILAMGTLPVFADMRPESHSQQRRLLGRLVLSVSVIYGAICVFILLGAGWFMPLLFGREFARSAIPLMIMVPFNLSFGISTIFASILDYRGRAMRRAIYLLGIMIANFILCLLLIPTFGANGVAAAMSISYLPYAMLTGHEVYTMYGRALSDGKIQSPPPSE